MALRPRHRFRLPGLGAVLLLSGLAAVIVHVEGVWEDIGIAGVVAGLTLLAATLPWLLIEVPEDDRDDIPSPQ